MRALSFSADCAFLISGGNDELVKVWKVADAPADFVARLLETIVGIEIPIARLEGKWKVSQNRPEADRAGVVAGLMGRDDEQSAHMAALVRQHLP